VRREITAFLEERMGNGYFGFKDPRTTRLMPMWHQVISELNLAPKIIFCLRNPSQVARSLNVRDGFSRDICEYRWFSYTVDFFRYAKESEFCTMRSAVSCNPASIFQNACFATSPGNGNMN
jgi:hypothetical protein